MRKKIPKILTIIFLSVFILQLASLIFLLTSPTPSQAAIDFTPQVPIGANVSSISNENNSIGEYVKAIYNYAIGVVGILATVVMMIGGIVWITAGGNPTRVSEAKAWIGAALTGLVLALTSYTILAAISPNLVNFTRPYIPSPEKQAILEKANKNNCPGSVIPINAQTDSVCSNNCKPDNISGQSYELDKENYCCVCVSPCAGKVTGAPCKISNQSGHCYDDKCLTTDGQPGEICGVLPGSTCMRNYFGCPSGFSYDALGRECIPVYRCCRPNP